MNVIIKIIEILVVLALFAWMFNLNVEAPEPQTDSIADSAERIEGDTLTLQQDIIQQETTNKQIQKALEGNNEPRRNESLGRRSDEIGDGP